MTLSPQQRAEFPRSDGMPAAPLAGELDLFGLVVLMRAKLRRTLLFGLAGCVAMVVFTLAVKPRFVATASLLIPPPVATSTASLALQAASGLDLVGGGFEVYLDIMKSDRVCDRLIRQFDLIHHYGVSDLAAAEKTLVRRTTLAAAKEGLIHIAVEDEDPQLAARLAAGYVSELDLANHQLAVTAASQRRLYYEQEMVKEKDALADAEVALEESQQRTGVVEPQMQVQAALGATEQTRAQLRARQVQLGALLQGETEQNPEVERVKGEVASLEAQLRAEQTAGGESTGSPMAKVPEKTLIYVRRLRDVKFHEALFEMLAREFEVAKQQEAKNVSMIEVLDAAKVPERKSWPPRTLYCLLGLLGGVFLGVVYTIVELFCRKMFANPENRTRLETLKSGSSAADASGPIL